MEQNKTDQLIREALGQYDVPFDPDAWKQFEPMLKRKRRPFGFFWKLKGFEFLLVLAAVFTYFNFANHKAMGNYDAQKQQASLPDGAANRTPAVSDLNLDHAATDQVASNQASATTKTQPIATGDNSSDSHTANTGRNSSNLNAKASTSTLANNLLVTKAASKSAKNNTTGKRQSTSASGTSGPNTPQAVQTANQNNTPATGTFLDIINTASTNPNASNPQINQPTSLERIIEDPAFAFEFLKNYTVQDIVQPMSKASTVRKPKVPKPFKKELRYGALFSADINSRFNPKRSSMGFALGANVEGRVAHRIAFELGLTYSMKRFVDGPYTLLPTGPEPIIYDRMIENISTVYHQFEVPLTARIDVIRNDKWGLYLSGGASANFLAVNNYLRDRTMYLGSAGLSYSTRERSANENGLFQGGTMQYNFYPSAIMGLGVEHAVGPKMAFYVQPTYRLALTDFGANQQRTGVFSMVLGLRFSTKK